MIIFLIETFNHPCYPNPCGDNAVCKKHPKRDHAAACVCIKGYFGDPFTSCQTECTQDNDCPRNRACRNQKCVDTCPGFCGDNAFCTIKHLIRFERFCGSYISLPREVSQYLQNPSFIIVQCTFLIIFVYMVANETL